MKIFQLSSIALGLSLTTPVFSQSFIQLQKNNQIAVIGNTLADRQQHYAWFETAIQRANADKEIVIRNLAHSADELTLRPRSDGVFTPDEWLTQVKADVVFAYFGFNESFKGQDGLAQFQKDLEEFLVKTKSAKYNGKSHPTIVLFSPIAHEDLKDPHYSDGKANNERLALYTQAMKEIAAKQQVLFVDLFQGSQELYSASEKPLTHNGIHMVEHGDKLLSSVQFKGVFGQATPELNDDLSNKIREAVIERNRQWHLRYRSVDQYNIYGGRGFIKYEGIDNNTTMLQEMAQRDVLTQNRDKAIWEVAQGREYKVDDSNLPKVDPVPTNKPEIAPYLSGEAAIKHLTAPEGTKIELVASEENFPELVNPVQMAFDTRGRLWVAAWPNYPGNTPTTKDFDKLLVFDLDPKTGKATKVTPFLDDLNCPTGFQFYKDGVILIQSPDLIFARDVDGDGKADTKERILNGLDAADSHHETNSICLEPGGAMYLSDGVFHRTSVETFNGPVRNVDGAIYRFEPKTNKFERHAPYGFANPHGRVFDRWGNDFITDATGNNNYFGPAMSSFLTKGKHPKLEVFWKNPSRPSPGTNILTSRHFPDDWQHNFLNTNVISFQGIFRAKMFDEGSGVKGETLEPLVSTDIKADPNFRPSAVTVAPDGSIYFLDWSNAIIGHLQHHLRDPHRDHKHGRIYRITYPSRPLLEPKKIHGEPIPALLELLKEHENDVRMRAKIELGARDSKEVIAATKDWASKLDKNAAEYEHHRLEALWVHQWHDIVDVELLKEVLVSPDPRARAQAVRVLTYWGDRVSGKLDFLAKAIADEAPRVRLEAIRALSFVDKKDAKQAHLMAYDLLKKDTDYYLVYVLKETLKQLEYLNNGRVLPDDENLVKAFAELLTDDELYAQPDHGVVLRAKLNRESYDVVKRDQVVTRLAKLNKLTKAQQAIETLKELENSASTQAAAAFAKFIVTLPPADLAKEIAGFKALVKSAKNKEVQRSAWAGLILAEQDPAKTWAGKSDLKDKENLIRAIVLIPDVALRAKFQPMLEEAITKASGSMYSAILQTLPLMGPVNANKNFAILAESVITGKARSVASSAILQLPRTAWDKDKAPAIAQQVLAYAKTVDPKERSQQQFIEVHQLGLEMATLAGQSDLAKELRRLGVSIFVVKAVHEQLRFDTSRIVVEKGKSFEILFDNPDAMPHNLVVVGANQHQTIGAAAQTMSPNEKDRQGRAYLPKDFNVLGATKLLNSGEKEKIQIKGIDKVGEYEFVCTFPGHWMIMWGKIIVTDDVDAYLKANPSL